MAEDRIVVFHDESPRRPPGRRRRRGLLAANVAVIASVVVTSVALAGDAKAPVVKVSAKPAAAAAQQRAGHDCHRGEGRVRPSRALY